MPSNQNRDNFIDKAFTVIAESIVKIMPIAEKEKKAYIYYRDGLAAQNNGDYSEALEYYKESLLLEENKIDRGETLKNMAIIYMSNGEEDLSIELLPEFFNQFSISRYPPGYNLTALDQTSAALSNQISL